MENTLVPTEHIETNNPVSVENHTSERQSRVVAQYLTVLTLFMVGLELKSDCLVPLRRRLADEDSRVPRQPPTTVTLHVRGLLDLFLVHTVRVLQRLKTVLELN